MKLSLKLFWLLVVCAMHSMNGQTWRELHMKADSLVKSGIGNVRDLPEARGLALRALRMVETEFGGADTNVTLVLDLLVNIHSQRTMAPLDSALAYAERSLAIKEAVYGRNHPNYAVGLANRATARIALRRREEARRDLQECIKVFETCNAIENLRYADAIHDLAYLHHSQGDFELAGQLFRKALAMFRGILRPNDPLLGYTLTMLAVNYWEEGLFAEAEPLLRESLAIIQSTYGKTSARAAIGMWNLSEQFSRQGKTAESADLQRSALAIMAEQLPPDDPLFARCLMGSGILLHAQGRYSDAADTLLKALDLFRRVGRDAERIVYTMQVIGDCRAGQKNYTEACSWYLAAIAIQDSLRGSAGDLNTSTRLGLAQAYMHLAKIEEADSLLRRVHAVRVRLLGSDNPSVAECLDAYSLLYRLMGKPQDALHASHRAVQIRRDNFLHNARVMSEKDAATFSTFLRQSVNHYLSAVVDSRTMDSAAVRQAADIILSTKGEITEQAALRRKLLVTEADSVTLVLAEAFRHVRYQLSTLYVEGTQQKLPAAFRREVDSLEATANELEALLARRSASFAKTQHNNNVCVSAVAARLPPNSALVEYIAFNYVGLNPDTLLPRCIALVLDGAGRTNILDLGEGRRIDSATEEYRKHFAEISRRGKPLDKGDVAAYRRIGRSLFSLIWEKTEPFVTGREVVFIAPDAGLNLVSFAGLIDAEGKHIIENYPLHYLSAGRDFLRLGEPDAAVSGLLAFGDPDFDAPAAERRTDGSSLASFTAKTDPYRLRNVRSGCEQLNTLRVSPLAGTRTEVETIVHYWGDQNPSEPVRPLFGALASEEAFKNESVGKRIIHFATHGYFLQGDCASEAPKSASGGENPLLQSGLLLAGANLHGNDAREEGTEDGILTALEVSAMNLRGTDLIVLSACETGLGDVRQGEGVYGLRRAFQMAGAKSVVSSLWKVPDEEAARFMKSLYSKSGASYPRLMQEVSLSQIKEAKLRGRPIHPYNWGAFVTTGEWQIKRESDGMMAK